MEMDGDEFMAEYQIRAASDGTVDALRWAAAETVGWSGAKRLAALAFLYAGMWVLANGMMLRSPLGVMVDPLTPLGEHFVAGVFVLAYLTVGYIWDKANE